MKAKFLVLLPWLAVWSVSVAAQGDATALGEAAQTALSETTQKAVSDEAQTAVSEEAQKAVSEEAQKAVSEALSVPRKNFTAADANSDGALSGEEFVAFINANADANYGKAAKIRQFKAYDRAFGKVDGDDSGQVTWAEFAAAQK